MPAAKANDATDLSYLSKSAQPRPSAPLTPPDGFGNHFESEAVPGTLPKLGNAPQRPPHGLYAEQISGTAFTVPRAKNQRSWVYRLRPSVQHSPFRPYTGSSSSATANGSTPRLVSSFHAFSPGIKATPQQLRWDPLSLGEKTELEADFVDGLATLAGAGDSQTKDGLAIHFYGFGRDMGRKSFYNSDGDFLIGEWSRERHHPWR